MLRQKALRQRELSFNGSLFKPTVLLDHLAGDLFPGVFWAPCGYKPPIGRSERRAHTSLPRCQGARCISAMNLMVQAPNQPGQHKALTSIP